MQFNFKKSTLIKLALILALLVIAPFLVPFTLEFIIVADLMGLEALIVFLLAYGKTILNTMQLKLHQFGVHLAQTMKLVAELYLFKPKIYLSHATASSVVMLCASSVVLACALWLPVMLLSADFFNAYL